MMATAASAARGPATFEDNATDDWIVTLSLEAPGRVLPAGLPAVLRGPLAVLFEGELFDRVDLARALGVRVAQPDADLVLAAAEQWGDDATARLRGRFAAVVVDRRRRRAIVAHDPMGTHPLFFAEGARALHVATSPDRLIERPGISRALNLPVMADFLCRRAVNAQDTFFAAVRRLAPGYHLVIANGRLRCERSWNPLPDGRREWLTSRECRQFDDVVDRAVERALPRLGRAAVFLSGGLDSTLLAAAAADLSRARSAPAPLALTLELPSPECDERALQTAVARELALPQHSLEFSRAVSRRPLLSQALDLTRRLPAPLANAWTPAYMALARIGVLHGAATILSGEGGDEWLATAPTYAADLLARGDLAGWHRFARLWQTGERRASTWRMFGWRFGVRPLLGRAAARFAPEAWDRRRTARLLSSDPEWIAPDPAIRAEQRRRAPLALGSARPPRGFRDADLRATLDDPSTAQLFDELYFVGRMTGARVLVPYFDPDVVAFVSRMPPAEVHAGDRWRGIQRRRIAARLPRLDVDRRPKVLATQFFRETLENGRASAIAEVGTLATLDALGVVDRVRAETVLHDTASNADVSRAWDLINLEAWARAHV